MEEISSDASSEEMGVDPDEEGSESDGSASLDRYALP